MATKFEFDAPQFVDFNVGFDDSDGADTFFDVECEEPLNKDEDKENKQSGNLPTLIQVKEEIMSPNEKTVCPSLPVEPNISSTNSKKAMTPNTIINREKKTAVRRLSGIKKEIQPIEKVLPNIAESIIEDLNKLSVKARKRTHFDGIPLSIKREKSHGMNTRNDEAQNTPTIELRSRMVNKNGGTGKSHRKSLWMAKESGSYENRKRKSTCIPEPSSKYFAMAEQILHFQKDTPPRFHSSSRRSSVTRQSLFKARQSYKPQVTIPQTPKLRTSQRSRPVAGPTREEKEELELKEMMGNQVKAQPLDEKVLQPPKPLHKSEKSTTVQEPFNLTVTFKKPAPKLEEEPYKFTANPVPRAILEKPVGVGPRCRLPITVPQSPAITKPLKLVQPVRIKTLANDNRPSTEDLISFGIPQIKATVLKKTEVKPFSFEVRDKELMEKKEKKIQEILDAEKKAREFKANPLPTFVPPKETTRTSRQSIMDRSKISSISVAEDEYKPFKARSPKVLRKKPFEPVLEHTHSQPLDLELYTERRAHERQQYELKQLEKEELILFIKEQMKMDKKRKEEEEIAKLRQEIVHKAQPMPKFRTPKNISQSHVPLTNPQSPKFSKRTRNQKQCSSSQSN